MNRSLEFLLGILTTGRPACVAKTEFDGAHGALLRLWQQSGLIASESEWNPRPSCPHCYEGVPITLSDRWLCPRCLSVVDPSALALLRFNSEALVRLLAQCLKLQGDVRQVDDSLWQLGSFSDDGSLTECFFCQTSVTSERGEERVRAYRRALLISPLPQSVVMPGFHGPCVSLLELLCCGSCELGVRDLATLLHARTNVEFDEDSGELKAGARLLGDVPVGSKEHALLACLWQHRDKYVPYRDLKRFVLLQTRSKDSTDEATFCQRLKNRMKKGIPEIDRLITTTNKGEGYRLRGYLGEP
jgi:hypothetical protein